MSSISSYVADLLSDSDALCFKLLLDCISLNCFDSVDFRLRFEKFYFSNSLFISTYWTRIKKNIKHMSQRICRKYCIGFPLVVQIHLTGLNHHYFYFYKLPL